MQAYTYSIKHIPSDKIYYGVRKSSTVDIGISYFSSSKLVKRMIANESLENFIFKVRKKFNSYEAARLHEHKMLKRLDVTHNDKMLNQAISSVHICSKDSVSELERRRAISNTMKNLWSTPEYKDYHPLLKISTEERKRRGRKGSEARAKKYALGEIKYKKRKPKFKEISIEKNGAIKIIARNQLCAYRKCGWHLI